jgi:hypothetical protein
MSQITIRNINPQVERILRKKARKEHISLSEVANNLIDQALGFDAGLEKVRSLEHFAGAWSPEDLQDFENSQEDFSAIDDEVWK